MTTTTTPQDVLAAFDAAAAQQPAILAERLAEESIPATVAEVAQTDLALALAGVRRALSDWHPRPPLDTADERELKKLFDLVTEAIAVELAKVLNKRLEPFAQTVMRTRSQLSEWNAKRPSAQVRPTPEQVAAMSDGDPADFETVEWEELSDGSIVPHYRVKPDLADVIDWTRRGLQSRLEALDKQTQNK